MFSVCSKKKYIFGKTIFFCSLQRKYLLTKDFEKRVLLESACCLEKMENKWEITDIKGTKQTKINIKKILFLNNSFSFVYIKLPQKEHNNFI